MPKLRLFTPSGAEQIIELTEPVVSVGRVEDNVIQIDDGSVSSHHAELSLLDEDYILKDLGSTNGTSVNGEEVTEAQLRAGDRIQFGTYQAEYISENAATVAGADGPEELPEAEHADLKPADVSERPDDFTNASPFQKKSKKAEPISIVAMVLAVLGLIGFGAAAFFILMLSSPFS